MGLGVIWLIYTIYSHFSEKRNNSTTYNSNNPTQSRVYTKPKPRLNVQQADITQITLSSEQKSLFDRVENSNENIFITGKAGTGKSVLLQYLRQNSTKKLVVVAPTGVAALNVGGQTIHSLFRIAPGFLTDDKLRLSNKTAYLLQHLDTVVIDEISMVRVDLMNSIDYLLRKARGNDMPFGGVQMVMFGDLYQLPPVVDDEELHKYFVDNFGGQYFFNSPAWRQSSAKVYELTHIFRQKDDEIFKRLLNAIRTGDINEEILTQLNTRKIESIPTEGIVTLATTNSLVKEINENKLHVLEGDVHEYRASIFGNLEQTSFPTDEILRLKKGAQVMLLKNDKDKRWVNGTIGYVDELTPEEVKVSIDGFMYSIPRETWNKIRYTYNTETRRVEEEVVSSFTQFPLKLAWAMTIHKAQGKTFGSAVIDLGDGVFAHGQTYVALSRCRSLDGVYLKREIYREDIIVDPAVSVFMKSVTLFET